MATTTVAITYSLHWNSTSPALADMAAATATDYAIRHICCLRHWNRHYNTHPTRYSSSSHSCYYPPAISATSAIRTATTSPKVADAAAATAAVITVSRFCRIGHWNSQHKTHPRSHRSIHNSCCYRSHRSIHNSCCYSKPLLMDQPLEQPPRQLT